MSGTGDDKAAPATGLAATAAPLGRMSGFRELVGYEVKAWREGYAEIALVLGPRHMNRMGIVHGGVYMTILDAAMGHAATWCAVPGNRRKCVTVAMSTNFMAAARAGTITAVAHLVSCHDRVATCRGYIRDDSGETLIAAQASFRYAPGGDSVTGVAPAR